MSKGVKRGRRKVDKGVTFTRNNLLSRVIEREGINFSLT